MTRTYPRVWAAVISLSLLAGVNPSGRVRARAGGAQTAGRAAPLASVDGSLLSALEWRLLGPFRGGRVTAVAGDPDNPLVFYMGTAHGGVWKTVDAGTYWRNISDGFFQLSPVGAIAIAPSNHDVIFVGMGESEPRQDLTPGDGVYKSSDGGRTWTHVGLERTQHISKIRVHPTNPDIVYVAAMGDIFGTDAERGIFRTNDGGKSWKRVLFKSERACAFDLTMDPANPNVLMASLDQFVLYPWDQLSGGPDSGLYKTTDGGETWTDITRNPGLPKGTIGKIGVAISPPRPSRVYAIVEAAEGGVYRSDDGGASWQKLFDDREQRREAASYLHITADTRDADTVYVQHVEVWKSTDGGRTFTTRPMQHSDHHAMWIDPKNAGRMIDGSDGGASVTLNGGASWSTLDNQPTADLFSLAIDDQDPYWVYGAQNDNDHIAIPSRTGGRAIGWPDYLDIGGGEGGQTAVKPDGTAVYAGDRTTIMRYDRHAASMRDISVWPEDQFGAPPKDVKERFYYSFPIVLSPHDPRVLYTASQHLFRTIDEGASWTRISPDLTRKRLDRMQKIPGGPVTSLASSLFYVSLIRTIAESPRDRNELWVGTDDSTVQMTRDGGKTWADISPSALPEWTTVTAIDVSPHAAGTAYLAANRVRVSDRSPYFYKTVDYGRTWQRITTGIRENDFSYVIREDPLRAGLLYAGTETGAYVSFDAGGNWQPLQRNLPSVAVAYMQVKNDDLVVATHGRGFWIMDHIDVLRQATSAVTSASAHLFDVAPAIRRSTGGGYGARGSRPGVQFGNAGGMVFAFEDRKGSDRTSRPVFLNAGQNPPGGALVEYYLKEAPVGDVTLTFVDGAGHPIQTFSNGARDNRRLPALAGMNRFYWDMRYPNARQAASSVALAGFEASAPVPPVAAPGRYLVRLTVGGETFEKPFEIRRDSRSTATDADLQAQFDLLIKIRDKASAVSDLLDRLRAFRRDLEARKQQAGLEELRAIEGELTRLTGSHSLELGPKGLVNKLGTLSRSVAISDARPTAQMYALFEELSRRIAAQETRLNEVVAKSRSTSPATAGALPGGSETR